MSQRFVVSFEPGRDGRPIGKRPRDGGDWVVLDRSNTELIHTYKKYLVEVANTLPGKRLRFVRVVMSVQDLFLELLPALLVAQWQRGKDEFSGPWTEIRSLNWGLVRAGFHDSRNRHGQHRYASVTIDPEGERLSFEVESGDQVDFGQLAQVVARAVGPVANLAAVISRQADSRRGQERWRR
jgi:hypothetical protein